MDLGCRDERLADLPCRLTAARSEGREAGRPPAWDVDETGVAWSARGRLEVLGEGEVIQAVAQAWGLPR